MSWKIVYSAQAVEDLKSIYEYIAYELLVPDTAAKFIKRIMEMINTLDDMPMKYCVYDKEPWKSKKLRYLIAEKYIIFYLPKEEAKTVNIVRIIYGGRDINKQLKETTEL